MPPAHPATPAPAQGSLLVVSGPSGVGKGAVIGRLMARDPQLRRSVSVTTREPRPNEADGVHYHFVDDAEFDRLVRDRELLEWANVHLWRYGTPRKWVTEAIERGERVVLEIDVQGALQIRDVMPEALLVFLEPPTWEELERRLSRRGTETEGERRVRLDTARRELDLRDAFDHVLVNDDLERCVDEVAALVAARSSASEPT